MQTSVEQQFLLAVTFVFEACVIHMFTREIPHPHSDRRTHTHLQTETNTYGHIYTQTDRQADMHKYRQIDTRTDTDTDTQAKHTTDNCHVNRIEMASKIRSAHIRATHDITFFEASYSPLS